MKILIIDDEKPLSRALELKLGKEGFETKTANNGEEGLKLATSEKFDLVLCDLIMPKMDGFTVLENLKQKGLKIPTLILTNLSQPEDEKRVRDLGAKGFYVKSDTPVAKIIEHVKEILK